MKKLVAACVSLALAAASSAGGTEYRHVRKVDAPLHGRLRPYGSRYPRGTFWTAAGGFEEDYANDQSCGVDVPTMNLSKNAAANAIGNLAVALAANYVACNQDVPMGSDENSYSNCVEPEAVVEPAPDFNTRLVRFDQWQAANPQPIDQASPEVNVLDRGRVEALGYRDMTPPIQDGRPGFLQLAVISAYDGDRVVLLKCT